MSRNKIAVIGGGQIGTIIALMATQKELGDITIIDLPDFIDPVKGKALDIDHLRPHINSDVMISVSSDYADIAGSDVVIVTAGVPRRPNMSREDLLFINIDIIKGVAEQIKIHCPNAFVIVATNPVDTMSYVFHKVSGFAKQQVAGLSGALDTGRFQSFIAEATGLSVKDVSCMVIGGHGPTMVPLVSTASVAGISITDLLSSEQIEQIVARTKEAGSEIVQLLGNGSAFISSAGSIMEMVEAFLGDKKRVISCSALCQGEYGVEDYFLGVPVVIGAGGVEKILEASLDTSEHESLSTTASAVIASANKSGL
ncbi:MAG: malate dehydrogenase [Chromatiales bacterium]|nr:malate dehydrogenase [Chromatiales bacterium]